MNATPTRMPFEQNKLLYKTLSESTPLVIRDFGQMKDKIVFYLTNMELFISQLESVNLESISDAHGDDCDACMILKNMGMRHNHDTEVFRTHKSGCRRLWKKISRTDQVNVADAEDFVSLALTSRAMIENALRSCFLFMNLDIRIYNKYLIESLSSFGKLHWSTLPQSFDTKDASSAISAFELLSNRDRNNSELYADPAPTFKGKIDYFRKLNKAASFDDFFDDCERMYSAFSDVAHGGAAFLSASNKKVAEIVMVCPPDIQFGASAHQLAEMIGVTLMMSQKVIVNFYLPVLIQTLERISDTEVVRSSLENMHKRLAAKIVGHSF